MVFGEDPYRHAPAFIGNLRSRSRLALGVTMPIGITSLALAIVRMRYPDAAPHVAGLYVCALLTATSFACAIPLMLGCRHSASSAYKVAHAVGMLGMNAATVMFIALTEKFMLAMLRATFADPSVHVVAAIIGMSIAGVFFMLILSVLYSAGKHAFDPPSSAVGMPLMIATAAAVAVVAGASLTATLAVFGAALNLSLITILFGLGSSVGDR
jgi:hypothetical protein